MQQIAYLVACLLACVYATPPYVLLSANHLLATSNDFSSF